MYDEFNKLVSEMRLSHPDAMAEMERKIGPMPEADEDSLPETLTSVAHQLRVWCNEVYIPEHPRLKEFQEAITFLGIAYPEAMSYMIETLGDVPMPSPITPDDEVDQMIRAITGICEKVGR